jgi:CubicO group peptidase (beta-lactamase class C family)
MLEHASGNTWETLMEEQFFRPLGMKRTGVGGTGTEGKTDQPWPHDANGRPMPHNGPAVDNPPVMGPAGTVHAPLADWAAFVTDQLRGARGQEALLRKESYHIIQKPDRGRYAMGWQTEDRDWGGGPVLTHAGTNTMNYAVVWMAPLRDFAVLVATNQGGEDAWRAVDSAAGKLIGWLQERRPPTNPTNPTNPADP